MSKCSGLLTWQGFYGLSRGMQGVDRGPLVLEGYPGPIWAPVTVNQDLVTVLCLDEGPSLGMDVEVNEFLKAPLVGFTVETRDQTHLGGVFIQEFWPLNEVALGDWTGQGVIVEESWKTDMGGENFLRNRQKTLTRSGRTLLIKRIILVLFSIL